MRFFFLLLLKAKYIGKENNQEELQTKRIDHMDKTLCIKGARISYRIWEVGGDAFYQGKKSYIIIYFY